MFVRNAVSFINSWYSLILFLMMVGFVLSVSIGYHSASHSIKEGETFSHAFLRFFGTYAFLFSLMLLIMIMMIVLHPRVNELPSVTLREFFYLMKSIGMLMLPLIPFLFLAEILVIFGTYFLFMKLGLIDPNVLPPPWDWKKW